MTNTGLLRPWHPVLRHLGRARRQNLAASGAQPSPAQRFPPFRSGEPRARPPPVPRQFAAVTVTLSTAGKVLNPATKIFAATNIINSYIISAVAAPVYDDRATLLFAPERSRLGLTSFLTLPPARSAHRCTASSWRAPAPAPAYPARRQPIRTHATRARLPIAISIYRRRT